MINVIFILIIFIFILFLLHYNFKEKFTTRDKIISNENTIIEFDNTNYLDYNLPPISVRGSSGEYPKLYPDHNYFGRKISANKLCVYNDDEIECIDAENLGVLMNYSYDTKVDTLPEFRYKNVCINTSCISSQTSQKMDSTQTKKYYLKSGSELEEFKDKCIHYGIIDHAACDKSKINLHSFIPEKCEENISTSHHATLIGVNNNSGVGELLESPKSLNDLNIYITSDEHHMD